MSKNPFLNALLASAYITLLVSLIFNAPKDLIPEPSIMIPIGMLSLFVLSAAMMGYFFLLQPIQLLVEGKKEEATKLFLATAASFAGITGVMVLSWLILSSVL